MFKKKDEPAFDQIDTLIGKDTSFRGNLTASGTIRVDGAFEGELVSKGDIVIGENGQIQANLKARNVLVAGTIKGNIIASGKVEVASTGKIWGDLQVGNLVIDDGAVFHGNCQMKHDEKPGFKHRSLEVEKQASG